MKINWKLRFKNKATLLTLCVTIIAFVYQMLAMFEVVPKVSQDKITEIVTMIINLLAMVGIVVDPTTEGMSDSDRAMSYKEPNK